MDIWAWFVDTVKDLSEREPRLVHQLVDLPSRVVDDDVGAVDAMVPELVAAARRLRSPWLEVYVRHWNLQSVVFHRRDVAAGLPEAVSLLERAHRPDADKCPQTVCVSQDVCAAYGFADGPGYAPERLQVSSETLGRIDPSWPCWTCITSEHMDALLDAGRPAEALAWATAQADKIRAAGRDLDVGDFAFTRAQALLALGRAPEAHQVLVGAEDHDKGLAFERRRRVELARVLLALEDRGEEALEALPGWEEVRSAAVVFESYATALRCLVARGLVPWGAPPIAVLAEMTATLAARGCPRAAVTVGLHAVDLAIDQGAKQVALAFLARVDAAVLQLERPLGAPEAAATRHGTVASLPDPAVPDDEAAAREAVGTEGVRLDAVVAIAARYGWPDVMAQLAGTWTSLGFGERARVLLGQALAAHPDDGDLYLALGRTLLDGNDLAALDAHLAPELAASAATPGDRVGHARWLASHAAERRGDVARAASWLEQLLDERPAWCGWGIPARLTALRRQRGDHEGALAAIERAQALAHREPDRVRSLHWDRMVVATRIGRWDIVRDSAAALQLPVEPGEGPIEEAWGVVRIAWPGHDQPLWARRTGPVTARVLSIVGPGPDPERHGDWIVFEPVSSAAEGEDTPLFPLEAVLAPGGARAFALDGVHPGEAALDALDARIRTIPGATMLVVSGDGYRLVDPATGEHVPAVYVKVAVRDEAGPAAVRDAFAAVPAPGPLTWAGLAEALGLAEEAAAHRALAEAWGM